MNKLLDDLKRYNPKTRLLLVLLTLAAVALTIWALVEVCFTSGAALVALAILALLVSVAASRQTLTFPGTHSGVTLTETIVFIAVIALGPFHAALLAAIEVLLATIRLKLKPSIALFNISNITVSCFVAALAYTSVDRQLRQLLTADSTAVSLLLFALPLFVLAATHYLLHIALVALMIQLRHQKPIRQTIADTLPWEPVTSVAGSLAAGLLVLSFRQFNLITALVTLVVLLPVPVLIYFAFKTYRDNLEARQQHYQEVTALYDSILEMLAMAIDAKDDVTHDHIQRVKLFARRLGEILGLSPSEMEALKAGALLHDIGKIGVPAYILNKPGKLTEHEFEQMKMHTIIGAELLANIDFRYPVVPIVRHHHERWDGRGYPDGLKGEQIPITARILTLVDTYDALSSDRPYHTAMPRPEALAFIQQNAGSMYDPNLVEVFLRHIDDLERQAAFLSHESGVGSQESKEGTGNRGQGTGDRGQGTGFQTPDSRLPAALRLAKPANGLAEEAPPSPDSRLQTRDSRLSGDRALAALHSIAATHQGVAALYEMSRTLSGILAVDDTLAILGNRLAKLLPFTTAAISLFNPHRSEFEIVTASGRHAEALHRRRLPAETGITGWVITNQKPMYNTNPILDLGFLGVDLASQYKGVMVFPLTKHGESLGAIAIYSTEIETYTASYIQLMEKISQAASDAVYNALAFEQAQKAATTDTVTGLVNTRSLAAHFEREKARSAQNHKPLSLLLISLSPSEATKPLAAASGNLALTDQILMSVGQTIRQEINAQGTVARYWDHSFIVLLPDAGNKEAAMKRNKIQKAIQTATELSASVTIGLATTPGDGNSFEDLLQAAHLDCIANRASFDLFTERLSGVIETDERH